VKQAVGIYSQSFVRILVARRAFFMIRPITYFIFFLLLYPGFVFGDCHTSKSKIHSTARFKLNDGEALDLTTNLTWSRCSLGTTWKKETGCIGTQQIMSLRDAKEYVQKLGKGWRIPDIEELHSIVEKECSEPAINPAVFPDVKKSDEGSPYWSITRMDKLPTLFYYVDFMNGQVDTHSDGFVMAVRLVRNTK
jgi:hypothetical protein